MGRDGRRDHDGGHARQLPQQSAVESVGTDPVRAGGHDLRAFGVVPDVRRRPVGPFVAVRAPYLGAGLGAQRRDVRLLLVVDHQVEPAVVQHRRRRRAPTVAGLGGRQPARPEQRAVEAEGVETQVAEEDVQPLPVGDRGLGREGVLQVVRRGRHAGVQLPAPAHLPRLQIERVDQPVVHVLGGVALAEPVPAALGRLDVAVAHHRGQEHQSARDDRRAPPESRKRRAPGDVVGRAPAFRQVGVVGDDAGRARPAELGPLLRAGPVRGQHQCQAQQGKYRTRGAPRLPLSFSHRQTTLSFSLSLGVGVRV